MHVIVDSSKRYRYAAADYARCNGQFGGCGGSVSAYVRPGCGPVSLEAVQDVAVAAEIGKCGRVAVQDANVVGQDGQGGSLERRTLFLKLPWIRKEV